MNQGLVYFAVSDLSIAVVQAAKGQGHKTPDPAPKEPVLGGSSFWIKYLRMFFETVAMRLLRLFAAICGGLRVQISKANSFFGVQDETRERRLPYGYGKDELAFHDRRRDDFRRDFVCRGGCRGSVLLAVVKGQPQKRIMVWYEKFSRSETGNANKIKECKLTRSEAKGYLHSRVERRRVEVAHSPLCGMF